MKLRQVSLGDLFLLVLACAVGAAAFRVTGQWMEHKGYRIVWPPNNMLPLVEKDKSP